MSTLRIFVVLSLLSLSAMAASNSLTANTLPPETIHGASVAASVPFPDVPLSDKKRPVALAAGIALVVAVFHRALARRQRA